MKSFHRIMGYLSGIFLLMIIISISVSSSYMKRNEITFPELFSETGSLQYGGNWSFTLDGLFSNHLKSSDYETIRIEESDQFDLTKEIFISSSIEDVIFIEEDRSDIQVDYYRELPDSKAYSVKYRASSTSNTINISATLSTRNIALNKEYKGLITVHIPYDYSFEKVTLDSGAAKIRTENIYTKTETLSIIASFGDIDIVIDDPIENVTISCNFGSIDMKTTSDINTLNVNCDMGKIDLILEDEINKLIVEENMGDINIEALSPIQQVMIKNNMGSIQSDFLATVGQADFKNNMGDIKVTFHENDTINVHVDTDLGSAQSDFPTVSENQTDFVFIANMGSINVYKK